MTSAETSGETLYAKSVAQIAAATSKPFFVQVGGFDGVSFDPLRRHIVERDLSGIIIEPVPCYFEKIQALYSGSDKVKAINCAVSENAGEAVIWRFRPEAVERGILPPHFAGISSFLMDDLLADTGVLGRSCPDEETKKALKALVEPVPVACRTLNEILDAEGVTQVDILQIDTEGYDFKILQLFDFARFRPALVQYEHQHLKPEDRAAAENFLARFGYRVHAQDYDTIAVLSLDADEAERTRTNLVALANTLLAEGRAQEALHILRYADRHEPGQEPILRALAATQSALGLARDAVETLIALKHSVTDIEPLLPFLQTHARPAIEAFNARLAESDFAAAESLVAALVKLVPQSAPFLEAAMSCNQALGRIAQAEAYARQLLLVEPSHERAQAAVAASASSTLEATVQAALNPSAEAHPLLRLRDLHDAGSAVLAEPLMQERVAWLDTLWADAKALEISLEPGSEWQAWEKHYRNLIAAADTGWLKQAPTAIAPRRIASLTTADGRTIGWGEARALAARTQAACAFFVAADETYIKLYARHFVRSVQKYCEAGALIVIHAIGGEGGLAEIVSALGFEDERVLFTADAFDAASVRTQCWDAPPKGLSDRPLAHFQSGRFLHVGDVLAELQIPVFVSDIDLLLQGEVRPLLARFADTDFVLNHNTASNAFGSRYTANLLLLNPRPHTEAFLATLAAFLDDALTKPEVTRWIDQVGLMIAQQAMRLHVPHISIAHFDTTRDVNNVMYGSYQDHPFTFLSLYHGFDTTSLEGENGAFERHARVGSAA
jgi:FkbM family methyltransferase